MSGATVLPGRAKRSWRCQYAAGPDAGRRGTSASVATVVDASVDVTGPPWWSQCHGSASYGVKPYRPAFATSQPCSQVVFQRGMSERLAASRRSVSRQARSTARPALWLEKPGAPSHRRIHRASHSAARGPVGPPDSFRRSASVAAM
jgi:hypothetical protein